jgi:orotidine-5'-phosphate decarboxylase
MSFQQRLTAISRLNDSLLCIGLDLDRRRLPAALGAAPHGPTEFATAIIAATADLVCAYKPNLGFYLAEGLAGLTSLIEVIAAIRRLAPRVPILLDAKFGDIDVTAAGYARFSFDELAVDAVTLSPYLGEDSLAPFLQRSECGAFILCKTSNPSSGDLQDLLLSDGEPLYERTARQIARWRQRYGTGGAVVGATYPGHVARVRQLLPAAPLLIPGIGAQGGTLAATVRAGIDEHGGNILVNASRAVLYASAGADYAQAARAAADELRRAINSARSEV